MNIIVEYITMRLDRTLSKSSIWFGRRRSTNESCGPDTMLPPRYITPPVPIAVFCKINTILILNFLGRSFG